MKKIIALLLACLMVFSFVGIQASAASDATDDTVIEAENTQKNTVYKSISILLVNFIKDVHSAIHQLFDAIGMTCILCNGEDLDAGSTSAAVLVQ